MTKIRVGIVGAAGYTGGELLRLLINHNNVELVFAQSRSNHGKKVNTVHKDLTGETDLVFSEKCFESVDVIFLCLAHGASRIFLENFPLPPETKVIDLSQDFRDESFDFVYGLTEWNRQKIAGAKKVANPGCFATAIQLSLLPLIKGKKINSAPHINATTGSTGAGQTLAESSHFSWRQNSLSIYKALSHQHLCEINRSISKVDEEFKYPIHFIPQRGSFTRGIFSVTCAQTNHSLEACVADYYRAYADSRFVHVCNEPIDLKQVVNTNKCFIALEKQSDQLIITTVIDNLLKGASGQALQNMNLMFGLKEDAGLKLKSIAF